MTKNTLTMEVKKCTGNCRIWWNLDFDQAAYYLETLSRKIKFDNLLVDDARVSHVALICQSIDFKTGYSKSA